MGLRGRSRNQRPRILQLINRGNEPISNWQVSAFEYDGCTVLDDNNKALEETLVEVRPEPLVKTIYR